MGQRAVPPSESREEQPPAEPRLLPLVLVDAANVVGSVPDGWWKDRVAATLRLREALKGLAGSGLLRGDVPDWARRPPLEVVLVVEGRARDVTGTPTVGVLAGAGTADEAIVERLVRLEPPGDAPATGHGRRCLVITADRELRDRVRALGADVAGPRSVYP